MNNRKLRYGKIGKALCCNVFLIRMIFGLLMMLLICSFGTGRKLTYASEESVEDVENTIIQKGPVFFNHEEAQKLQPTLMQGERLFQLQSYELQEIPVKGELTYVSASIPYELEGLQEPPQSTVVTLYDEDTQQEYERELPCIKTEEKTILWEKSFSFPITVYECDATSFLLGDLEISKDENWKDHEVELLQYIGLSEDYYRIDTIEWNGDYYEVDGMIARDALAKGEKQIRNVEVTYGGEIRTPDMIGYQYAGVYELMETEEMEEQTEQDRESDFAESNEDASKENRTQEVTHKSEERDRTLSEKVRAFLTEHLTVIAVSGIVLFTMACILTMLVKDKE